MARGMQKFGYMPGLFKVFCKRNLWFITTKDDPGDLLLWQAHNTLEVIQRHNEAAKLILFDLHDVKMCFRSICGQRQTGSDQSFY